MGKLLSAELKPSGFMSQEGEKTFLKDDIADDQIGNTNVIEGLKVYS